MMKKSFGGIKNKINIKPIFLASILVLSIISSSFFFTDNASAMNEAECKDMGGTWSIDGATNNQEGTMNNGGNTYQCRKKNGEIIKATGYSYKAECDDVTVANVNAPGENGVKNYLKGKKCRLMQNDRVKWDIYTTTLLQTTDGKLDQICNANVAQSGDAKAKNKNSCISELKKAREKVRTAFADNPLQEIFDRMPEKFSTAMMEAICNNASSSENKKKCLETAKKSPQYDPTKNTDGEGLEDANKTCDIDGIGWILCPVINFLGAAVEAGYSFVSEHFLEIESSKFFDSGNESGAYRAWQTFRDIANIMFVIVFLVVVMSQISGIGITNYGLKKLLPKMVVAAILVNVSWYLTVIAVDISNIVGHYSQELLSGQIFTGQGAKSNPIGEISGVISGIIAGGIGVAIGIAFAAGAIGSLLIVSMISLVTMIAILVARQAVVILLVVFAPIAIILMILPNTEKLYGKWQKMFIAMLITYPVCGVIMGGSSLAASILTDAAMTAGDNSEFLGVIYSLISLLPMIATPMIIKKSLDGLGSIGGKLASFGANAGTGAKKRFENSSTYDKLDNNLLANNTRNKWKANREAGKKERGAWRTRRFAQNRAESLTKRIGEKGMDASPFEMAQLSSAAGTLAKLKRDEVGGDVAMAEQLVAAADPKSNTTLDTVMIQALRDGNSRLANGAMIASMTKKGGGAAETALGKLSEFEQSDRFKGSTQSQEALAALKNTVVNDEKVNKRVNENLPHAMSWATGGSTAEGVSPPTLVDSMADYTKAGGDLNTESFEKIAAFRPTIQSAGMQSGAISQAVAADIINNPSTSESLSGDIVSEMQQYAETGDFIKMSGKEAAAVVARGAYTEKRRAAKEAAAGQTKLDQESRDSIQRETLSEIRDLNRSNSAPDPRKRRKGL